MNDFDHRRISGLVIVLMMFLLIGMPQGAARADIGLPPAKPSGASLGLAEGERTNVRMVEEEVNLTIESTSGKAPGGESMRGRVDAVFLMRNLGTADEALDVWFPLAASVRFYNSLLEAPEQFIQDFQVWVDGLPLPFQRVKAADPVDPSREIDWASFPISFPSGKDVTVRVTYTIYPSGWSPFGDFEYIMQTGASWNGTIGRAVVKVHLPYPVTNENVSLSGRSIIGMPLAPQPDGYTIEGSAIRWEFIDLEPGPQDNIFVDVLDPQRYQDLVDARSRAAAEPGSADAQVALAKASSRAILILKAVNLNGGGGELAQQVKAAYRRALELAPDREDILVEYIDYLMRIEGYLSLMFGGECPVEACDLLDRALKLYPNNPDLINWDKNVQSMRAEATFQAQYQQTLTAEAETQIATSQPSTPTAMAETYTPTITPADTSTPTARPSATVTPLPTSVSAADEPPDSRAPESQSAQIVLVVLGLVIMIAAGLLFRSGVLARRK